MQERVREAMETMERSRLENEARMAAVAAEFGEKERRLNDRLKREMNAMI